MKIRIISDIHLEFFKNNDFKLSKTEDEKNSILILAGDICVAARMNRFNYFFKDISNRFHSILYVLGNHEFYKASIQSTKSRIYGLVEEYPNIIFLDDSIFEMDDIVFIGATLWTDFYNADPICMFDSKRMMNDFKIIQYGPDHEPWRCKFSPHDAYTIHKKSVNYITEILNNRTSSKKYVIITHHAPHRDSCLDIYKNDILSGAYYTDLSELMIEYKPKLWIHGHMHNSSDYMIDETRVICNSHGYHKHEINEKFIEDMVIDL